MFVLVCLAILLSNYIAVANLSDSYKVGYFVGLLVIAIITVLLRIF